MDEKDMARVAVQATGLLQKGLKAKIAAVAAVIFLIGLIVLGSIGPAPSAAAAGCQDTGAGTDSAAPGTASGDSTPASSSVRRQQIAYAQTIDAAARKAGLAGRATLIALMTAMQESTLQNLDHGDRDSLGLFQQRPSMNWGTKAQIMTPSFAADSFFTGRGGNPGLNSIAGWQQLPLGTAAQRVQKSAYPKLYAGHESAMRALAHDAKIDLERPGTAPAPGATPAPSGDTTPATSQNTCQPGIPTTSGPNTGGTFTDGRQTWTLNNPRSVPDAIAWAKNHSGSRSTAEWGQACLRFTAVAYGWGASGVPYAIDQYTTVPKAMRHDKDRNPPPGALLYWTTGSRAGHIAIYLGGGKIASNDILRVKYIDVVDADLIEKKWGAVYVGWTPPYYPKGS